MNTGGNSTTNVTDNVHDCTLIGCVCGGIQLHACTILLNCSVCYILDGNRLYVNIYCSETVHITTSRLIKGHGVLSMQSCMQLAILHSLYALCIMHI